MSVLARTTNTTQRDEDASAPTLQPHVQVTLGAALRAVYERASFTDALPDDQVELLLRLRHKERDRRRVG